LVLRSLHVGGEERALDVPRLVELKGGTPEEPDDVIVVDAEVELDQLDRWGADLEMRREENRGLYVHIW